MRSLRIAVAGLVLSVWIPITAAAQVASDGLRLADYLDSINRAGDLRIVYSTDLVADDMRLESIPPADPRLDDIDALLQTFGLTTAAGPSGSILVIALASAPDKAVKRFAPTPIAEIVVTSSQHRLQYASPESHTYLDRELATRVPTTADEAVRVTHRLPGVTSGGISVKGHVRGGEVNEVLFLLDGLRLYEPYHLKDFQSVATIINSNAIAGIDSYTGAYSTRFGDRMSGVTSIELREATKPLEHEIAVSFFNTSLLSLGTFGGAEKGDWLLSARRGNLDLIADIIDPEVGSPDYQDYLAHVGWEFGPRADVSANLLMSSDKLNLFDPDRGEAAFADYNNEVFWLTWSAAWSNALKSRAVIAFSNIRDRRNGALQLPGIVSGNLDESREFDAFEFRQDWEWSLAKNWMLRFGADIKDLDARYDLSLDKTVVAPFDDILDNAPSTQLDFNLVPAGAQYAGYAELRWRISDAVVADIGIRWDQQNYTTSADDKQYSPRASILLQPGTRTDIRFGWGQYYQAQEINELQVSDGVPDFFPAQRAEHFVIALDHSFESGIALNASIYRKSFRTLRPRFENTFNALTLLPELQFDRIRIDPTGSESIGAEITMISGSATDDTLWWVSYAWAEVEDATDSGDVPRSWDQTHSFKAGLSRRRGKWSYSLAGEVHTGWPGTDLAGELTTQPGGNEQLVLQVAPRNSSRYSPYHTLDGRISREFSVRRGKLMGFLEVSNLYNRRNQCCDEYSLDNDGALIVQGEHWLPLVPSLGIVWRF